VDAFHGLADSGETGGVSIRGVKYDVRGEELWDEVGLVLVKALLVKAVNDDGVVGGGNGHRNSFGLNRGWKKRKARKAAAKRNGGECSI
jgi:hypothetical protein